jgi:hypothetical protein
MLERENTQIKRGREEEEEEEMKGKTKNNEDEWNEMNKVNIIGTRETNYRKEEMEINKNRE